MSEPTSGRGDDGLDGLDGLDAPGTARALLDAVVAIGSDLEVPSVLQRIVESACTLTGASHGFLGVLGEDGAFVEYVVHRADEGADDGEPPEPAQSLLRVPVRVRGEVFGNLYLTEKCGEEEFSPQDEAVVAALAGAAGTIIDNARAFARSQRRQAWLEASARVGEALQPRAGVDDVLADVATIARGVSGVESAAVVHREDGGWEIAVVAGSGDGLVELVRGLEEDGAPAEESPDPLVVAAPQDRRAAMVPIPSRLETGGLLVLLTAPGDRGPDAEELGHLRRFVEQVGIELDRTQALDERHQLVLVADRDRIARDLHDLVIQRLFATGLQLQAVRRMEAGDDVRALIEAVIGDLDVTIRDIRSTIFELQHRRATSWRAEVRALVREYVPVLGFTPLVRTTGPVDSAVTDEAGHHLLATLREALSNVARHARAEACVVEVAVHDGWLTLVVRDDGRGLPAELHESGVRNARRRATDVGGRMRMVPGELRGTRLEWSIPLGR